jgi:hypothetical protein
MCANCEADLETYSKLRAKQNLINRNTVGESSFNHEDSFDDRRGSTIGAPKAEKFLKD